MRLKTTLLLLMLATVVSAQKSIGVTLEYTVTCAGIADDGNYIVEAVCKGKKASSALANAKKAAVHAILFKGVSGSAPGCASQRAIVTDPSIVDKNVDFFKAFFNDKTGKWGNYVTEITDVPPMTGKVKGGYSATVTLIVMKDQLRQMLEKEGIIRGLGSGF